MNKASWLWAPCNLHVNYLLTPHSHPSTPVSKFSDPSQLFPLPLSFSIFFPASLHTCLLFSPFLSTSLSCLFPMDPPWRPPLVFHYHFESSFIIFYLLISLLLFNQLSSVLLLVFPTVYLLCSGVPGTSSGARKGTKTVSATTPEKDCVHVFIFPLIS